MPFRFNYREQITLCGTLLKWALIGGIVGVSSGSASALFLVLLGRVTAYREAQGWLLWLLPIAGALVGLLYQHFGQSVEAGNNLLLERARDPGDAVPLRIAPLVLLGTLATHLCGGSAGREGTAVQMGGALANLLRGPLRLSRSDQTLLILSGISGGFGSVFGTPLAGTAFGLEVLTIGQIRYEALIPCFAASVTGDAVCRAWGVTHTAYAVVSLPMFSFQIWLWIVITGILFGAASFLFAELVHAVGYAAQRRISVPALRPFCGGLLIIALTFAAGTRDYLGLSLPLLARSFGPESVPPLAFAWKIVFTAVTVGSGFKGGEVTPLFCIGAALGGALAHLTGQPVAFFAALGFVAVFAGASNTPLACTLMGIELFGAAIAVPLAAACIIAYIVSGHRGIYLSQRVGASKSPFLPIHAETDLRTLRETDMEADAKKSRSPPD